jgi:serine/threonine-protein kinase HipA
MNDRLYVHYQGQKVGCITQATSRQMQFQYDESWIGSVQKFPISISLPLDGSFTEAASHHYFANLLPEGSVREQICKSLRISPNNDFELLKAIGGDCAGALTITAFEQVDFDKTLPRYKAVTDAQLSKWSQGLPNAFAGVTGHGEIRLSLAGAQDKLPVHVDGEQLLIPLDGTPSTHILKFASPHYSHLPENETFITLLAKEIALPVAHVRLYRSGTASTTLITRYDRYLESGKWFRLHQEDFCQALGIDASRKYEKEGGPSLKQCAAIIRQHSSFPLVDLQQILRWFLFNLLVGNADGHGKNVSLLYSRDGSISLAPFYDLVCTRNYKNLARQMAMQIGGTWDPDLVGLKQLEAVGADLSFRPKLIVDQTQELSELITTALPTVIERFSVENGPSPVLERLPMVIRRLVRRVNSQLKTNL